MTNVALGSLTPVTSPNSSMAVLVAKPSTGDSSKKDFGLVASTAFATATGLTAAVAQEVTDRNTAIGSAVSTAIAGIAAPTLVIDATYTANGAIDVTKSFVVFNSTTALTMTLANGTFARGPMVLKNLSTGVVSIAALVDGASSTVTLAAMASITLVWSVARTSWAVVSGYDPGVAASALAAATLADTLLFVVVDPSTGIAYKTTLAALRTSINV